MKNETTKLDYTVEVKELPGGSMNLVIIIAAATGALISLMTELNGRLSIAAGAELSVTVIHLVGLGASLFYLAAARKRMPGRSADAASVPFRPWFLAAGILGIGVIMLSNYGFAKGGMVFTVAGFLAGQTLAAFFLELLPLLGGRKSSTGQRLVSLLLILPGAGVLAVTSGAPFVAAAAVWGAGGLLMIQSLLNSRSSSRLGTPVMVLSCYLSALLILLPSFFLSGGSLAPVPQLPLLLVVGGGLLGITVIVISSILYGRAPAMQVMLAIFLGQLGFGLVLDLVSRRPVPPEFIAGMTMVCAGLFADKWYKPLFRKGNWYFPPK